MIRLVGLRLLKRVDVFWKSGWVVLYSTRVHAVFAGVSCCGLVVSSDCEASCSWLGTVAA